MTTPPREAHWDGEHASYMPGGAALITDPTVMNDIVSRLQHGDPTRGWEGDRRLVLAWNRPESRWELWRLEHDEQYRLVMRSKPNLPLQPNLIDELVRMDVRRGFDVGADTRRHNAAVEAKQEYDFGEKMGPKYEKLKWALRKDDRVGAGL